MKEVILVLLIIVLIMLVIIAFFRFVGKAQSVHHQDIYREVFRRIPDLVWMKNPQGAYLLCNHRFELFFGATEKEIIGKTDYNFVPKDLADMFRKNDLAAIAKGEPSINEEEVAFANDGHKEVLETIKTPIFNEKGELLGVLGIARDITELVKNQERINESRQMLNDVLNTIPARVFWKNRQSVYQGANTLFAIDANRETPQDLVGRTDYELFWERDADLYTSDDKKVMDTGVPKINYEEPQTDPDGTVRWLKTSKIPMMNAKGEVYGILGTYEDITVRKKNELKLIETNKALVQALEDAKRSKELEVANEKLTLAIKEITEKTEQLQRLNEELQALHNKSETLNDELTERNAELSEKHIIIREQNQELSEALEHLKATQSQLIQSEKMASLGILTAGVAHEINNPLNYIMGAYHGLEGYFSKQPSPPSELIKTLLNGLKTGVDKAAGIVHGLNQFSRSNEAYDEDCNINNILKNCQLMMHSQLKHTIEVVNHLTEEPLIVTGNTGKLHQVFVNILSNALQAIEGKGKINVKTKQKGHLAVIEISDTGKGISKEHMDKITDPFFTTKEPGKGTGLGLSITYSIIQEHKGTISFSSKMNEGTTVKVELPLKI